MNKKIISILIILLISTLLLGCTGEKSISETNNTNSKQTNTPTANNTPESKNIENGLVGSTYKINYMNQEYEIKLTSVEIAHPTTEYFDKSYIMANFELKNISDSSGMFTPDIYLIDSTGEQFSKTFAVGIDEKYSKTLDWFKKLNPGAKTTGWVTLDLPKDTSEFDIYFQYSNDFLDNKPLYIKYKITK
jgi:hypothetical protein